MHKFGMEGTKWTIFEVSVDMFSKRGYHAVSMRDIAKEVNIKPSSIYNHFISKEDILTTIYDYYSYHMEKVIPDLNQLLKEAETEPPKDVMKKVVFKIDDPLVDELQNKIFLIASTQMYDDNRAQELIIKNLYDVPKKYIHALLQKMINLGRIEPIDIEAYAWFSCSFFHSTTLMMRTYQPIDYKTWEKVYHSLIDTIVEIPGK